MRQRSKHMGLLAGIVFVCTALLTWGVPGSAAAIAFINLTGSGACDEVGGIPSGSCADIGIDYSDLTGNPITSVHFNTGGVPHNLDNVNRLTGARSANNPSFAGASDELKVATVRQSANQGLFATGTIFTGNGVIGQIVKIDPDGTVHNPWLTGVGDSVFRGGFFQDRFGVAGGDLIAVSSPGGPGATTGGQVFRITSAAVPVVTLVATIFRPGSTSIRAHLEGVITVPDDVTKYGPWAGKIVTGDEDRINTTTGYLNGGDPKVYAIDPTTGVVLTSTTGIPGAGEFRMDVIPHPEDFDFIEGDFFGASFINSSVSPPTGQILKASTSDFPAANGDILITQEYPVDQPDICGAPCGGAGSGAVAGLGTSSGLYQVKWNPTGCGGAPGCFEAAQLARDTTGPEYSQWEHVTFVPPSSISITKSPDGATFLSGDQLTFTIVVTSNGPGTATNVTLSDPIPGTGGLTWSLDSVVFNTPNATNPSPAATACSVVANQLDCSFGNLTAGETATVVVKTQVSTPAAACNGIKLDNTATATADGLPSVNDTGDYTCTPVTNGKTITIGPSSMEGAIKISAGDFVNGGYSFKTNFTGPITITANVSITGACLSPTGTKLATNDTITVPLGSISYNAVSGSDWKPTGNANSILSWQGSVIAPATLCGDSGNRLDASKGAVFNATISGVPTGGFVTFRFKYRDPAAKGKPNTNCLDAADPNRNRADVCGASWSETKHDP